MSSRTASSRRDRRKGVVLALIALALVGLAAFYVWGRTPAPQYGGYVVF